MTCKYTIKGCDDGGELFSLTFTAPDPDPRTVYLHAINALWDDRWTPGSVAWQVYQNGHRLGIGENFSHNT